MRILKADTTFRKGYEQTFDYEMQMAIDKIDSFETFEHVNVNVFNIIKKSIASQSIQEKIQSGP